MKMYCVKHTEKDFENSYFESCTEAFKSAKEQRENAENKFDMITVTVGTDVNGDYAADHSIVEASNGKEIAFDYAVQFMNDDIREELHIELAPCDEQMFFDEYCKAHKKQFDEEFDELI